MVRTSQPHRVIHQGARKLLQVCDQRIAERDFGTIEAREFVPVEPQPAARLANVRVDPADPDVGQHFGTAGTLELGHGSESVRGTIHSRAVHRPAEVNGPMGVDVRATAYLSAAVVAAFDAVFAAADGWFHCRATSSPWRA